MNAAELTGRERSHVVDLPEFNCALHIHAVAPFLSLRRAAGADGIDLVPASGFRDFERQLRIWNEKYAGERPLLDASERLVGAANLSPDERIDAILQWSALPGASRHHWGTDVDLIDRNALAGGQRLRLTADQYAPDGPFAPLAAWLDRHAARFGFFRPYRGILSGVQAEPWHFSFAPLAETARRALIPSLLREAILQAPIEGKERILARLDELYARFVARVDLP
ncbi:MAG TPA: M15 family metallopeptidase [Steroidobacteraceae bacterium]|nr:M15 family metallopeptidase [Steroidobacteraceae bacterium]